MNEELLKKIADNLERIAICMENGQLREIAMYKKTQIADKKTIEANQQRVLPIREKAPKNQTIRVKTSK